jgi:hypothetical protein
MCFWFGLEILRLVFKKSFLNIVWFISFDSLEFSISEKILTEKLRFFRHLENFAKKRFSEKKSLGTS